MVVLLKLVSLGPTELFLEFQRKKLIDH